MMRFLKQRWVIAALAVGATLLFIHYVYPKIKKVTAASGSSTPPANANPAANTPAVQSLKSRLVGPVSAYAN